MSERVCPWWMGYLLASPVRRLLQNPRDVIDPYVREGMNVLEPRPGMGFFTLALARRVGSSGRVIAVDVQPKMIQGLRRRLVKAGLAERVDARVVEKQCLGVEDVAGKVDFTLAFAFAMVHEMPDSAEFFQQAAKASGLGAQLLLAEPSGHVSKERFEKELQEAAQAGFKVVDRPRFRHSQAPLLEKSRA